MRFTHLFGLFLASSAFGCMAAERSAGPPPLGPKGETTVVVPQDKAKNDAAANAKVGLEATKKAEEKPKEEILGGQIGDAFGQGGLGLAGTGTGGGGTGDGIGLGNIGTIGHGAGSGTGQGYGSGSGALGGSTSGKKGRVAAATATTSGAGLATEVIQRVVRANVSQIQSCYEKAMAKDAGLAGKVEVKFVIDGQGAVTSAVAADTNITNADMVSCVLGAVKRFSFPAPDGGGAMVVTYPFNFSSADP